ncbi:MAG: pirin-like C-terminal cupin domain-containing protein [Gammaproteobacteria bacterium]
MYLIFVISRSRVQLHVNFRCESRRRNLNVEDQAAISCGQTFPLYQISRQSLSFCRCVSSEYTRHNALVFIDEGLADIGLRDERRPLATHAAGVLAEGDRVDVHADREGAAFLVLVGRPLDEPIFQYGPFVMNSRDEIEQAIACYREGRLV